MIIIMKKYLICSLLALLCTALTFSSCGKNDDDDPQPTNNTTNNTTPSDNSGENSAEVKNENSSKTETEIITDSFGNIVGTRTTNTTIVNGKTTVEVVTQDASGKVIDNNATFSVKYNIGYGIEGTLPSSQSGKFGDKVTVADKGNLTNGDWEFAGWNTQANESGVMYEPGSTLTLTTNVELTAIWKINYAYAIQFDPNGATDGEYQQVLFIKDKDYTEVVLPKPSLIKGNLVFKGWCANADGLQVDLDVSGTRTIYPAGIIQKGDSYFSKLYLLLSNSVLKSYTITLYAVYGVPESEKTEFKYNIVFNSNGYKGTLPDAIGFSDYKTATFKFPANTFTSPSSDMVFVGWKATNQQISDDILFLGKTYSAGATWSYVEDDNLLDQISYNFKNADKFPTLYEPTVTLTPIFAKKYGSLSLSNYSGTTYTIFIDGEQKGYLDNGKSTTIEDLALNTEHTLEIYKYNKDADTYSKITKTTQTFTFTKAGEKMTYDLPKLATVTVKHGSSDTYKVTIDDFLAATWKKSGTYSFEVSPNVQHKLYVEQQNGYLFNATYGTKTFTLAPGETVTYSGPNGNAIAYFK